MLFHLRYIYRDGEMLDRSMGKDNYNACRLLWVYAALVMLLGRCWSVVVGTFARPEPWNHRLSRPLCRSAVPGSLVECCCPEVCCIESNAALLVLLVVLLVRDVRRRNGRRGRTVPRGLPIRARRVVRDVPVCIGPFGSAVAPENWFHAGAWKRAATIDIDT